MDGDAETQAEEIQFENLMDEGDDMQATQGETAAPDPAGEDADASTTGEGAATDNGAPIVTTLDKLKGRRYCFSALYVRA